MVSKLSFIQIEHVGVLLHASLGGKPYGYYSMPSSPYLQIAYGMSDSKRCLSRQPDRGKVNGNVLRP